MRKLACGLPGACGEPTSISSEVASLGAVTRLTEFHLVARCEVLVKQLKAMDLVVEQRLDARSSLSARTVVDIEVLVRRAIISTLES
jgi:hypothetical protein